jgi:hypothetical protein
VGPGLSALAAPGFSGQKDIEQPQTVAGATNGASQGLAGVWPPGGDDSILQANGEAAVGALRKDQLKMGSTAVAKVQNGSAVRALSFHGRSSRELEHDVKQGLQIACPSSEREPNKYARAQGKRG